MSQRASAPQRAHITESEPSLPAVHILHLAAAVRACGGPGDALIEEACITTDQLSDPSIRIPLVRFFELTERAVALSGEPGIGIILGLQTPIARFGSLGFAVLASATLRDAIAIMIRYMPTITTGFVYSLRIDGEQAVLEFIEHVAAGAARETLIFGLSTALWRLTEMLTGRGLVADVEFPFPEPPYFARLRPAAPGICTFDSDVHRVRFDKRALDIPLVTADPAAARSALAQCERELAALTRPQSLVERVNESIWIDGSGVLTPAQLARRLGMAERTLKRRLAEFDTSYTQLLEEQRKHRACELLRSEASIEEIAERLGYSDASNFTRAFRRWTGESPRAFRRRTALSG